MSEPFTDTYLKTEINALIDRAFNAGREQGDMEGFKRGFNDGRHQGMKDAGRIAEEIAFDDNNPHRSPSLSDMQSKAILSDRDKLI